MTANQINYAKVVEEGRSNLAQEQETQRHNMAYEYETARHNSVTEMLSNYANQLQASYNAEVARSNQAREAETYRSNVAQEQISMVRNDTDRLNAYTTERKQTLDEKRFDFTKTQTEKENQFRGTENFFRGVNTLGGFIRDVSGAVGSIVKLLV